MKFENVYFINGTAYAGKSTMVKLLAEKYDGIACEENYQDRLLENLDTKEFPNLTYTRDLQDWGEFVRRTPDEYEAWVNGVTKECTVLEIEILKDLVSRTKKKIFVDTNISVEILHEISDENHVLIMLADPNISVQRFFERPDKEKQFLYQLLLKEDNPEDAMINFRECLKRVNSQERYMMFQKSGFNVITRDENISSKSRYNPHVFTEQGLYMLMTVLKGPLAVKQSKALIRTFKKMKDYILENRDLIGQREILQLSMETANNRIEINKINSDMLSLEKQISDVAEGLKDVVTKSELADMMNSFVSDDNEKWLMFNAKFSSADEVYESIYKQAKSSIYVVDNYIGLRTLVHLKNSPTGVNITLFSDNVGNNKLHNIEFMDFCKEYPSVKISMKKTGGIFHDRFIVLDYGTANERIFLCGASSKDAGARITSIVEDYGISKYAPVIATLLKNPTLILPH